MKPVLIAYATQYGATREIADAIAAELTQRGLSAEVCPAAEVTQVRPYDAVILGSAAYFAEWLPEAAELLESFQDELTEKPVWLFSDGPTEEGDPLELLHGWRYPERLEPLVAAVNPRGVALFGGRVDSDKLSLADWLMNPALHETNSDNCDWKEVEAWAATIAETLQTQAAQPPTGS